MSNSSQAYIEQLQSEISQIPQEHIPALVNVIHAFREEVVGLPDAKECFEDGWRDVKAGKTYPIETLWEGMDGD